MSQDAKLKSELAEVKAYFREEKKEFRYWKKAVEETYEDEMKESKDFDRWYRRQAKKRKMTPAEHELIIQVHRGKQHIIYNSILTGFIGDLLELGEVLSLSATELDHDQDKLGKHLRERRKLELKVPKSIGKELKEWVMEREHEKKEWQRANR